MLSSVDVERKVFPIIMQCLEGMEQAANSINEKDVSMLKWRHHKPLVNKYASADYLLYPVMLTPIYKDNINITGHPISNREV